VKRQTQFQNFETLTEPALADVSLREKIERNRHPLSSFVLSTFLHSCLILVLLLLVTRPVESERSISLLATFTTDPTLEKPDTDAEGETVTLQIELPAETSQPSEVVETTEPVETSLDSNLAEMVPEPETELAKNPFDAIESALESIVPVQPTPPTESEFGSNPGAAAANNTELKMTLPTGGGLAGRTADRRPKLVATEGGSEASEAAVEKGLAWIVAHQQDDGSWRLHHHKGECNGRCPDEGTGESTTAATGLALMALLGSGCTHEAGAYQTSIGNGIDFLLERIRYTPHGGILADGEKRMYAQAIATIALAEAYGMTGDSRLREPVEACRKYIVAAQHSGGSWGYNAGSRGDLTVTGWQLMALKSCHLADLPTDRKTWQAAQKFVDSVARSHGNFGYKTAEDGNLTTTSIGLLAEMLLGMHREHATLADGSSELAGSGPSKTDIYYNYYAAQVLHHLGGIDWKNWNAAMRDYLIQTQVAGQGHADGSWYFPDEHGRVGGRLYTTAMAVMTLEVYYRYLPLYQDDALEAELGVPKNVFR
jgi:hypothetical protein